MGSKEGRPLDGLNIEYAPISAEKTAALEKELNFVGVAVTEKGLFRLFHHGYPHYFTRLDDALDFYDFIKGGNK
jgi:hypothetical protein